MEGMKNADEETMDKLVKLWQRMWMDHVMPKDLPCSTQIPISTKSCPKNKEFQKN